MNKFFRLPFAVTGSKTTVPDDTQVDGSVSYSEGYGADYSADLTSDPDALPIERTKFNDILYDITMAIREQQTQSIPTWIPAADNDGVDFPYEINVLVRYNAGSGMKTYQSLTATNTALPSNTTYWRVVSDEVVAQIAVNALALTLLAQAATNTVLGNFTSGTANIVANAISASRVVARLASGDLKGCTISELLDMIGSAARGDVIYKGASGWNILTAGTSGYYLKTLGPGADPVWDSVGGVSLPISIANGGTGQITAPLARTALGTDDAANLTTGIIPSIARIATGTPTGSLYVRDDRVLAAPTPPLTYLAVGTYLFGQATNGTSVSPGGSIAGSSLRPASIESASAINMQVTAFVGSGTWQLMGYSNAGLNTSLWLRIA